jgi:dihydroorotase
MQSESLAALAGGVTSVFEMPNTQPQTTTLAAWEEKMQMAKDRMHVNYAFFPGATNDNIEELRHFDVHKIPGIKLFMGSSTGNMLVDKEQALDGIFSLAHEMSLPLMAHCEDTTLINQHIQYYKQLTGSDDPDVKLHPLIRDEEACLQSTELAVRLAHKHNTHLHVAHISTQKELPLLGGNITGEATVAHLLFSVPDYGTLGTRIKCNPAVKTTLDRDALRKALSDGTITTVATDHAPHTLADKQGGALKAMSGMPMVQFSLVSMLSLVDEGVLTIEQLVKLMCHNPSLLFSIRERGFLREGYKADIAIVKRFDTPWTLDSSMIKSKCGWSPLEGRQFHWSVVETLVNGVSGVAAQKNFGQPIEFI